MDKGLEEHGEFKTGSGRVDVLGRGWHSLPGTAMQRPEVEEGLSHGCSMPTSHRHLGVSRNGKSPVDSEWAEEGETWRGLGGMEGTVQGEGTHSHLRSSRLLLGQARCWPGGFWVLCRQASMAELGAGGVARSVAGSL